MALTEITQPAAHIAQVAAITVGALWAYFKYLRGRTFRPRAQIRLEASLCSQGAQRFLLARVSMENHGLSYVRLESGLRVLFVDEARTSTVPGVAMGWQTDPPFFVVDDLFREDEGLEPGETLKEDVLVPLEAPSMGAPPAYRVRVFVRSPPPLLRKNGVRWAANTIVLTEP